ncbi:MAG: nuclear transport factor 2 family protein [Myxococcota bacterium]|nr:nuclear transport factor 2 family protein [Myxococcota bacterium]
MEPWELAAREAIRDLVARYNANGDSGRFDPLLELFAEDAVLEVPDHRFEGRAAIRRFFEDVASGASGHPRVRLLRHYTATHQIDVENEREARGRCYYQVLTEAGLDHWGRYVDRYRCEQDRWLFASRKATVDGSVPGSWARRGR